MRPILGATTAVKTRQDKCSDSDTLPRMSIWDRCGVDAVDASLPTDSVAAVESREKTHKPDSQVLLDISVSGRALQLSCCDLSILFYFT